MPITIKTANVKYKNSQGQYVGVNSVSDNVTNDQIAAIQSAGEAQLSNINSALQGAKDSGEFNGPQGPKGDKGDKGTKGDKGDSPSAAEISEAAEAWLSGHIANPSNPPLDSSLTLHTAAAPADQVGELKSAVDGKAPAIIFNSESKNDFTANELNTAGDFTLVCNAAEYGSIAIAKGEELFPQTDSYSSEHFNKDAGKTVTVDGTFSSETYFFSRVNNTAMYTPNKTIKAGDIVNLAVCFNGSAESAADNRNRVDFYFLKQDESQSKYIGIPFSTDNNGISTTTVEMTDDIYYVRVYVRIVTGTFNAFNVTWSGNIGVQYSAVSGGSVLRYPKDETGTNGVIIIPAKAYLSSIADTKEYIDNHIPSDVLMPEDLVYLFPEMFGAKGDGIVDDTTSLQNCINSAISAQKPVRGYGTYKTTSGITIDADNMDVYIHKIVYNGSSSAVIVSGRFNKYEFGYINATSSNGKCISVVSTARSGSSTERNKFSANTLYADKQCVEIVAGSGMYILYNVFDVKVMYSLTGDCITSDGAVNELSIYNTWFSCTSGWCFNGVNVKLYNCTMEGNCYGGVWANYATIQNCRARELMDTLMHGNPLYGQRSGILYKIKNMKTNFGIRIKIDDTVYYDSIDLSDAVVEHTGDYLATLSNAEVGIVDCPITFGDLNYKYGMFILGSKMILHGKDRICVPQFDSFITVESSDCDLRDVARGTWDGHRLYYPTKFKIAADDCVIRLAPSYCAEGYSEFTVDMSTKMATIYDRRGNVIFDPAENTNGVYRFNAIVDHTIDDTYQTDHDQTTASVYPINSGYCDVWEVTKIS